MTDPGPTAYHEAGHAFAAWHFNVAIKHVSLTEAEDFLGSVLHDGLGDDFEDLPIDEQETKLRNFIVISFAGIEAQRRYDANSIEVWHDDEDRANALEMLWGLGYHPTTLEVIWQELLADTKKLVETYWESIELLATNLLQERELTGDKVDQLLQGESERPSLYE